MKPMGVVLSLVYFAVPALVFVAGFWILMPLFIDMGMLPYYAYSLGLGIPLTLLLVASLLWLKLEGRSIDWETIKDRFRLKAMNGKAWLWSALALLVGSVIGFALFGTLSRSLIGWGIIPIPEAIPAFMSPTSLVDPETAYNEATGGLVGNWPLLLVFLGLLIVNILGEELWWRGVVLPRQERAFGESAWLIHGFLWAIFHIFKWWDVVSLVPITLSIAFVCSRLKSTTPGIVIHGVTNGIAIVPLFMGIAGLA